MVTLTNRYADHAPLSIEDAEAARERVDGDDSNKDAHNETLDLLESTEIAAANQIQHERERKFRQLGFGVVLFLIFVAVLWAVAATAGGNKPIGQTGAPLRGVTPGDAAFHPPPNFSSVCTRTNVGTTQGYDECNDACTVASCCHDTDPTINCLGEFPEVCAEYEPCKVLLPDGQEWPTVKGKKKTVPPAPSNLANICSGEAGGDDADRVAQCDMACVEAACCWWTNDDITNCYASNKDICEGYMPCRDRNGGTNAPNRNGNEHGTPTELPPKSISEQVAEICLDDDVDVSECEEKCAPAACCFLERNVAGSCAAESWCNDFAGCKILQHGHDKPRPPDDFPLPASENPTPVDVNSVCAPDQLFSEIGLEKCKRICEDRKCCFLDGDHGCREEDGDWCEEYVICTPVMKHQQPKNTPASQQAQTVTFECAPSRVSTKEGLEKCRAICDARKCCFLDGEGSCQKEKAKQCSEYEACRPIMKYQPLQENPARQQVQTVDFECATDRLSTEKGLEKCREICSLRECCFVKGEATCAEDKREWCGEYEACRPAMEEALNELSRVPLVDLECSPDRLLTEKGREKCKIICDARNCCFLDGEGSCQKEKPKWCDEYESCRPVMEKVFTEPTHVSAQTVDFECAPERLSTEKGLEKCREACILRECCFFEGERNCSKEKNQWCREYEACRPFMEQALTDVSLVELECSPERLKTEKGLEKCKYMCNARKCCFLDGERSCLKEKPKWCLEYEACRPVMERH